MTRKRHDEERDDTKGDGVKDTLSGSREAVSPSPAPDGEVVLLRAEVAELSAKWLRALADLDNVRKRTERERRRWSDEAREEILVSLLEVVDGFDRALACGEAVMPPPEDAFRQGIELILAKLREILEQNGVRPIDTCGATFDPRLHEAVGQVESKERATNEIVSEAQKGYMIGDRVLRCSRVLVAK